MENHEKVEALKAKLATFSKAELIDELIGALVEVASPRNVKPDAQQIGCMRAECPTPEKCTEEWKCLNPMHADRNDHGSLARTVDNRASRSRGNGSACRDQQVAYLPASPPAPDRAGVREMLTPLQRAEAVTKKISEKGAGITSLYAIDKIADQIERALAAALTPGSGEGSGTQDWRFLREMPSSLNDACRSMEAAADEIDRLRGVVREGWQPIETAPKDGTFILAHVPGRVLDTMAWDICNAAWRNGYDDHGQSPTHWQPLPAPPSSVTQPDNKTGGQ